MKRIYVLAGDEREREVTVTPGSRRVTVMMSGSSFPFLHWSPFPRLAAWRIGRRLRSEGYRRLS